MSDKIYVKHNLGPFQQPYIFQQPTSSQNTVIGTTQSPSQQPVRYPFTYQNVGETIVQQPYSFQTARQGSTQQPNTYPFTYNIQNTKTGNTTGTTRQPLTYQVNTPYPFIARYPFTYPFRQPSTGNTQEPNTYAYQVEAQGSTRGNTTGTTALQGTTRQPSRYSYQSPSIVQSPATQPNIGDTRVSIPYTYISRYPFRYPFTYDYGVASTGDTDIPVTITENFFLQELSGQSHNGGTAGGPTAGYGNIRSTDSFTTTSTAAQSRQDNIHFKHEVDITNFSGKIVFRLYVRAATTNSPDSGQGSQSGTKTALFENSGNPSGINSGNTTFSTTYIEIARYEIPSSYLGISGYRLEFGNKNSIAIPSTAFQSHGFLLHTDSATNTQTEAFPTNNTVTFYNNCLGFKVFNNNANYSPTGFQLRYNSLTVAQSTGSTLGTIEITVKFNSVSPSPTRELTFSKKVKVKIGHTVTFQSGTPPSPGGPQFPGGGFSPQQPAPGGPV